MADSFVNRSLGTGDNDGTTWANAYRTDGSATQSGLTDALAGGTCWVKPGTDTAASGRILTSPGTIGNPTQLVGVLAATTNEPPVEADLLTRGTDTLPIFQATGGGSDVDLTGNLRSYGIRFDAEDEVRPSDSTIYMEQCEIKTGSKVHPENSIQAFDLFNCDFIAAAVADRIVVETGGFFFWHGGVQSGAASTDLVGNNCRGVIDIRGVDLSNIAGNVVNNSMGDCLVRLSNCKMPASFSMVDTVGVNTSSYRITAVGCSSTTGKGAGASFQDFIEETFQGTVELETTAVRTGTANDGATGAWGWKMTPNVNSTRESVLSLTSPWMPIWIEGDGTTAKTITVYISNSGGADYNEDDVSLEVFMPDDGGTAQHDHDQGDHSTNIIPGSTTAITDDTDSTWGTGGNNPQKMAFTSTPDFEGQAYARVHFWKTFSSSPETLYVDPDPEVS